LIAMTFPLFDGSLPLPDVAKGSPREARLSDAAGSIPNRMKQKFYSQVKMECVFFFEDQT
jgi:hypothetical protein